LNVTEIEISTDTDVVIARKTAREMAATLEFGLADQTRLATAVSELTRNVVQYAGRGVCVIKDLSDQAVIGIRIVVEDNGPGIPDPEQAMADGFSTGNGLGAGLPGTRRLVHQFKIESEPGHTKVTIDMVKKR